MSQRDAELTATDITVRFGGVTALDHVSLRAAGQEVLGIIGPNGAGKTTLFNVVCGFVTADEGSLIWDGQPLGARALTAWPGWASRARSRDSGCSRNSQRSRT